MANEQRKKWRFFLRGNRSRNNNERKKNMRRKKHGENVLRGLFSLFFVPWDFWATQQKNRRKRYTSGKERNHSKAHTLIHIFKTFFAGKKNTRVYFTSLRAFCSKREICFSHTHNFCLLLPSIHKHLSKFVNLRKEHAEQFAHSFERSDIFDMFVRRELSARILFAFLFVFLFFSFHSKNSSLLLSGWCAI